MSKLYNELDGIESTDLAAAEPHSSPFLRLPREVRLLIFALCLSDRSLVVCKAAVPKGVDDHPLISCGMTEFRGLFGITHQLREEVRRVRLPPFSLHFATRKAFCQFLACGWSVSPDTGERYVGSRPGLLVSQKTLQKIKVMRLAPGTTEVGYLNLSQLERCLPMLERLELDLRRESMWAYSRIPNITQQEVLVKEINWRLGTIFGIDASSLRKVQSWTLVVYASFMLPADPEGRIPFGSAEKATRLSVVRLFSNRFRLLLTRTGISTGRSRDEDRNHRLKVLQARNLPSFESAAIGDFSPDEFNDVLVEMIRRKRMLLATVRDLTKQTSQG
jgi:hypothetical protein